MPKRLRVLVVVGALALNAGPASAGPSQVSATGNVTQNCTALTPSTTAMTFPAYDVFTNANTPDSDPTPATFTTKCTNGSSNVYYTVSGGNNCTNSPVSGDRAMKSGSNYLAYQLFQDSGYSQPWAINPTTCAGTTQVSSGAITSDSQSLSFRLYAQIPAGQDPPVASNYTDQVTVAVNY
jgi:spore coat protein U-like protein